MEINNNLETPKIIQIDDVKFDDKYSYIGCAGFEDRTLSCLDYFIKNKIIVNKIIGIEYKPFNKLNKKNEFEERVEKLGSELMWIEYHRHKPKDFEKQLDVLLEWINIQTLIVDISGMSKFCIMILLQKLKTLINCSLIVLYAEAKIYHPTEEIYNDLIKKNKPKLPFFLTDNLFRIITTPLLSSVSMQGYPILLIAFSTFNHLELIALHNEMSPRMMVVINGDPLNDKDKKYS